MEYEKLVLQTRRGRAMTTNEIKHEIKSGKMYGGVDVEYDYEVAEGRRFLYAMTYTKGERKAIVEFAHGYMPYGRENAYMIPVAPEGRTRSYKNRENAKAKAYEFVCGK
jgi:hypothetical protein